MSDKASKDGLKFEIHINIVVNSVNYLLQQYQQKNLKDYDVLGVYILIEIALLKPNSWLSGRLKDPISKQIISHISESQWTATEAYEENLSLLDANAFTSPHIPSSVKIATLPEFITNTLSIDYILKKLRLLEPAKSKSSQVSNIFNNLTVMDIFNLFQLHGIKKNNDNYINTSLVHWSLGNRPYELLFYIPCPLQVLEQQACGRRVVTMFTTPEDLSRKHVAMLYYMKSHDIHEKTSFEFTIHDLKHMELFTCSEIYHEQIGFFRSMLRLGSKNIQSNVTVLRDAIMSIQADEWAAILSNISSCYQDNSIEDFLCCICGRESTLIDPWYKLISSLDEHASSTFALSHSQYTRPKYSKESNNPKQLFTGVLGLDDMLYNELEYIISDMNCYSTHLLKYLYAKIILAVERKANTNVQGCLKDGMLEDLTSRIWVVVVSALGMLNAGYGSVQALVAAVSMLQVTFHHRDQPMTESEGEAIRNFFKNMGK